jgi:protein TonB
VHQVHPEYPAAAHQAGITGVVDLRVIIAKDGKVRSVSATRWPDSELAAAATQAVRHWVYQPTLRDGEPVEVISTVQVNFALSR